MRKQLMTSNTPGTAITALPPIFIFNHESKNHNIRTVKGEDGQLWFVAKDICDALGLTNSSRALRRLDADEKGQTKLSTLGGIQTFATVNQSGLFALVFQSRMTAARGFRKWATATVIPAIYRDGLYVRGEESLLTATTSAQLNEQRQELEAVAAQGIEAKATRGLNGIEERFARYDTLKDLNRGRKRRSARRVRFAKGEM